VSPSAFGPPWRLACLIPGQPRSRLGEPASHVLVIHAAWPERRQRGRFDRGRRAQLLQPLLRPGPDPTRRSRPRHAGRTRAREPRDTHHLGVVAACPARSAGGYGRARARHRRLRRVPAVLGGGGSAAGGGGARRAPRPGRRRARLGAGARSRRARLRGRGHRTLRATHDRGHLAWYPATPDLANGFANNGSGLARTGGWTSLLSTGV